MAGVDSVAEDAILRYYSKAYCNNFARDIEGPPLCLCIMRDNLGSRAQALAQELSLCY